MYRNKQGKSVFTGFVQRGQTGTIVWVGKDEKADNDADVQFFMRQMQQYD